MERVSLLKVESYQDGLPEKLVTLLEPLGGLASMCKRGDRVLLKPNFILARPMESAATTHPEIIRALIRLLQDIGCQVAIGDSPGLGSTAGVIRKLNLTEDLKFLGVQVVELDTPQLKDLKQSLYFERHFKNLHLAEQLNDFSVVINLPKLKSHGQMGVTLATKNLFGCVAGPAKVQWHYAMGRNYKAFARLLVEIAFSVNASLHILDGIIGMDGNGPSNGRPRELNLLGASSNPIALDRVIVEILQQKTERFPIFGAAREMNIPGIEMSEIEVMGDSVVSCLVNDFEIPATKGLGLVFQNHPALNRLVGNLFRKRLTVDRNLCSKCRQCETQCPVQAITINDKVRIDEQKCIRCYCCQELCPVGALVISDSVGMNIIRKLSKRIT